MKILQPPTWKPPRGYNNGVICKGRMIFVAGQIGWNSEGELVSADLVPQVKQALTNILSILKEGDAKPEHVVKMTWFVKEKAEYSRHTKEIGQVYRSLFENHYSAMTLVEVSDLLEDGAKVEIEAIAVIPD